MSRLHDMGGRFGNGPIPLHKNENNVVKDNVVCCNMFDFNNLKTRNF